jgi:hypothetical protein
MFLRSTEVTLRSSRGREVRNAREHFTQEAQRVAASFASFDPHARFLAVIDEVTADGERNDPEHA